MDLFDELALLKSQIGHTTKIATSFKGQENHPIAMRNFYLSLWLSELLEIKRARLRSEVLIEEGENPFLLLGNDSTEYVGSCTECEEKLFEDDDIPASFNIPGVTDGVQCICRRCWNKDPQKYKSQYDAYATQLQSGEFDVELPLPCPRCKAIGTMTEKGDGTLFCDNCGLTRIEEDF